MKRKERNGIQWLKRIKSDYVFRTFVFASLSFLITAGYAIYNLYLGAKYKTVWNIGISGYYALLLCIRAYVLFSELKFKKAGYDDAQKENARKKLYFVQSIVLFIIDFALIAPISMMVMQQKEVNYSIIPAISMAAYTTYKITVSARNYIKTRKESHLSVKILRNVNFVDAFVSVLSLQYTLVMTFGGGIDSEMLVLCAASTFIIWMFLIFVSVLTLIRAVRIKKSTQK